MYFMFNIKLARFLRNKADRLADHCVFLPARGSTRMQLKKVKLIWTNYSFSFLIVEIFNGT